jgi:hypothetical protein
MSSVPSLGPTPLPPPAAPSNGFLDRFVRSAGSPSLEGIRPILRCAPPVPAVPPEQQVALLEQYKIYVEMADRISARRGQANTFFLAINTGVFTILGVLWEHRPSGAPQLLFVPWMALVVQCLAWFWTLRSYRQLSTAKYAVVGALEELLPTSPYWSAEWTALGCGNDPARYWPISHVEQLVPALFAVAYTIGLVFALWA